MLVCISFSSENIEFKNGVPWRDARARMHTPLASASSKPREPPPARNAHCRTTVKLFHSELFYRDAFQDKGGPPNRASLELRQSLLIW